jgi:hypothetical protein
MDHSLETLYNPLRQSVLGSHFVIGGLIEP